MRNLNYCAYKLKFSTPVHFGGDSALSLENAEMRFCADTLFSALCHAAQLHGGSKRAAKLCEAAAKGELLLSDAMPWREQSREDVLYIPRPILSPKKRIEVAPEKRKQMKKLRYIPAKAMDGYFQSVEKGVPMDFGGFSQNFGLSEERTRVAIPAQGDARPYFVGIFYFSQDCGLYFISACSEDALQDEVQCLLTLLQYSGIGGKISSGLGKFEIVDTIDLDEPFDEDTEWLNRALLHADAPVQMTLSACLPADDELEAALDGAEYQMIRRGGFISDPMNGSAPQKKRAQAVFQAGSTFRRRFQGQLSEVGASAGHAVYRYNRPLWVGVSI